MVPILSDHLKSGQRLSLQNRPMEGTRNSSVLSYHRLLRQRGILCVAINERNRDVSPMHSWRERERERVNSPYEYRDLARQILEPVEQGTCLIQSGPSTLAKSAQVTLSTSRLPCHV